MSRLSLVVGLGILAGCPTAPPIELSGTAGGSSQGSGTSGGTLIIELSGTSAGTGGEVCGPEGFDVLGHCYRRVDVPEILSLRAAAAADFDGDLSTDLVVTCDEDRTPSALCLFSVNSGVVKTELDWSSSTLPHVHAADFDADGTADVLVSSLYRVVVYTVDHEGFHEHSRLEFDADLHDGGDIPMYPARPIDLDQDGKAEIVTGSGYLGLQVRRFDDVTSKWVPSGERLPLFGCGDVADARVADLDDDGFPELVALGSHNDCDAGLPTGSGWNRVSVFTPSGLELVDAGHFPAGLAAERIELADFDGDQILDLLVAATENMMFFRGTGDRSFKPPIPIPGLAHFGNTSGPRAGDFHLDGFSEILVPQADYSYSLLVGLPAPAIVPMPDHISTVLLLADIDDDGHPDFVSLAKGETGRYHLVLTVSDAPPMD